MVAARAEVQQLVAEARRPAGAGPEAILTAPCAPQSTELQRRLSSAEARSSAMGEHLSDVNRSLAISVRAALAIGPQSTAPRSYARGGGAAQAGAEAERATAASLSPGGSSMERSPPPLSREVDETIRWLADSLAVLGGESAVRVAEPRGCRMGAPQ